MNSITTAFLEYFKSTYGRDFKDFAEMDRKIFEAFNAGYSLRFLEADKSVEEYPLRYVN